MRPRETVVQDWANRPWGHPWARQAKVIANAAGITEIGLSRGMCFGPCPAYTMTLSRSVRAQFIGEQFVDLMGAYEADFPVSDFDLLALAVTYLEIGHHAAKYAMGWTDVSTMTTWIVRKGKRIEVEDYGGAGPEALETARNLIDAAGAGLNWRPVGTDLPEPASDGRPLFVGSNTDHSWRPPMRQGDGPHWTQAGRPSKT